VKSPPLGLGTHELEAKLDGIPESRKSSRFRLPSFASRLYVSRFVVRMIALDFKALRRERERGNRATRALRTISRAAKE
jgi:hypothetical protein